MPARNNLWTVISGLLATLALTGLMYIWYVIKRRHYLRLKQLKNEIRKRDLLLEKLNGEKKWLLQEIHHRVKNNLQIVISLLNSQSAYLHNVDALDAIRKSQHRMYAISLIHRKQYQSDSLAEIDMKWYIEELVEYISDYFSTGEKIRFILNTASIKLDVAQAVPIGLILNEAISNAIQYAFPGDSAGQIEIHFNAMEGNEYLLKIADNGVGLPVTYETAERTSLGMSLINGLTEQLNGEIRIWNEKGLSLEISFKRQSRMPDQSGSNTTNPGEDNGNR